MQRMSEWMIRDLKRFEGVRTERALPVWSDRAGADRQM